MKTEILKQMTTRQLVDNQTNYDLYFIRRDADFVEIWQDSTESDPTHIRTIHKTTFVRAKWASILQRCKIVALMASVTILIGMLLIIVSGVAAGNSAMLFAMGIVCAVVMVIGFYSLTTIDQ